MLEKSMRKFDREVDGRVAMAEIAIYDEMIAELNNKEYRARKFARTHVVRNDGAPMRKDKRKMYIKERCYSCDPWHGWSTIAEFRRIEAERIDAIDAEIERCNAENERKTENMRKNAEFQRWLQYA